MKVAQKNIDHAGLSSVVEIIVGAAINTLPTLQPNPPFDVVFIDADKEGNVEYFTEAKRLVRSGGVILGKHWCCIGVVFEH
jgi:predicted O-methyltransferase YrrM